MASPNNKAPTLSAEQQQIVGSNHPYIEVGAIPGSGKTFTLVQRARRLIANGTAPNRILIVSFSRQTVSAAKSALHACANLGIPAVSLALPGGPEVSHSGSQTALDKVVVTTFHSLGLRILNDHHDESRLGRNSGQGGRDITRAKGRKDSQIGNDKHRTGLGGPRQELRLISSTDSQPLLDTAISDVRAQIAAELRTWNRTHSKGKKGGKNAGKDISKPSRQPSKKPKATVRTDLKNLKESSAGRRALLKLFESHRQGNATVPQLLRFPKFAVVADLLDVPTVELLRRAYERRKREAGLLDYSDMVGKATALLKSGKASLDFDHVLLDEFQDTSPQQCRFLAAIARTVPNIMVAGDEFQAIYNFAGARYTPLSRVLKALLAETGRTVKRLTLSRSRRLTQANANFAAAIVLASGRTPPHIVGRPGGTRPRIVSHAHWDDLRDDLVVRVSKLIESGVPPSEIVVLGRVKALLTSVQASLHSAGINVQHLGRSSGIKHVLRVLRLLQWCERQARATATAKIIAMRPSEVNQYFLAFVEGFKKRYGLPARAKKLKMAVHDLKKLVKLVHSTEGRYIACSRVYMRLAGIRMRGGSNVAGTAPARKNGQLPLDDAEIRNGIACWTAMCRLPDWDTAGKMRRQILEIKRSDRLETRTIHSAKGREWDHVFVVGATEGLLPHYRATTKLALEEELNLMYVAVTRTRKQLTLMHSPYTYSVRRPAVKKRYRRVGNKKVRVKAILAPSPKFTQLSSLLNHPRLRAAARTTTR